MPPPSEGVAFVRHIAEEAAARGIVDSFEVEDYIAVVGNDVSKHRLARMTMVPGAGVSFLDEHRDLDEWPDLDEDLAEEPTDPNDLGDSERR